MLERLWNGWRAEYVQSVGEADTAEALEGDAAPAPRVSVFAGILESGASDVDTHIVHRGDTVFVICNRFPYAVGHLLVLPYRQITDLEQLSCDESAELWATTTHAVRVLKAVYSPDGLNVGINLGDPAGGSISDHLHVHVVPRWSGDSNFMTATAETRTLPEALPVTAERIRTAWNDAL
ncbi:HIT domain-containing protein [soil metagenome]